MILTINMSKSKIQNFVAPCCLSLQCFLGTLSSTFHLVFYIRKLMLTRSDGQFIGFVYTFLVLSCNAFSFSPYSWMISNVGHNNHLSINNSTNFLKWPVELILHMTKSCILNLQWLLGTQLIYLYILYNLFEVMLKILLILLHKCNKVMCH